MSNQPPFPPPPPPPPPGGNPYGQNPYGNNPQGGNPQNPYGGGPQNPYGGGPQNPYGGNPYQQNPMGMQSELPNATAILVLGIVSIVMCWCYGVVGLVCGIIGLVLSNKAMELYRANPAQYTQASYKNMNAGRICSIIGLALSVLTIIWFIIVLMNPDKYYYYNNPWRF